MIDTEHLIASDDKEIHLEAKQNMSVFDYINYLVSCMECITDPKAIYLFNVFDTQAPPMYGTYFTVSKVSQSTVRQHGERAFEVDVGYPTSTFVTGFRLNQNEQWTILYNYQQD